MNLTPIGIIHSPHQRAEGTPIQAALASGVKGTVEVFPEYAAGLRDLDGFERIWLVYWFDRARPAELVVTPYLDTTPRGLFVLKRLSAMMDHCTVTFVEFSTDTRLFVLHEVET